MARIVLVRHGPVTLRERRWVTAAQVKEWILAYDDAGLSHEAPVPAAVLAMAADSAVLVASPLRRSTQSAARLAPGRAVLADAVFAEAGLPVPGWRWMAMPIPAWAVLLRMGWYLGWSADGESLRRVVLRAARAADLLQQLSGQHGSVLHVGHGILLSHIGSQLVARGWQATGRIAGHWSMRVFEENQQLSGTLRQAG